MSEKNLEKLEQSNETSNVWLQTIKDQWLETLKTEKLSEVIDENWILTIDWLAKALWMEKQLVKTDLWTIL